MDDIINVLADCVGAAFHLGVIVRDFILVRIYISYNQEFRK